MNTTCNHTLHHDTPGSTWHIVPASGGRRKVECKVCGKFYGYMRPAERQTKARPRLLIQESGVDEQ